MHWLLRNPLADPARTRGLNVRVLDTNGRATLAGAEVSVVSGSGRRQTRLADAGSGYNSQNDMPVHLAVAGTAPVRLQLRVPAAGRRDRLDQRAARSAQVGRPRLRLPAVAADEAEAADASATAAQHRAGSGDAGGRMPA